MGTDPALARAAYDLAEEIRDRRWDHLSALRRESAPAIPELVEELRRRVPGFLEREYSDALAEGLQASR